MKTTVQIGILLSLVLVAMVGCRKEPAPPEPVAIQSEDTIVQPTVGIGQIRFGMTLEQIQSLIGAPPQTVNHTHRYPSAGLSLRMDRDDETLTAIACGDPEASDLQCRTDRNIGIGSTLEELMEVYGEPSAELVIDETSVLIYPQIAAEFTLQENRIIEMTFKRNSNE